jgi:D-alanyl-D-alanine carboxypeptidase/D-alanyl-D-alanine-endopeptidase (penicillin-binding protein 4)
VLRGGWIALLAAVLAAASARAQVGALAADLGALLGGGRHAVLVMSLDRGDTLFSHRADERLAPASNLKLFSTAAALHYLGADFRWSTYLLADAPPQGGVVAGDLTLFGTGDPTLGSGRFPGTARALEALADSLRAAGVREVAGSLVADGSFFDPRQRAEGWTAEDQTRWYGVPVAALAAGENVARGRPVDDAVRAAGERFRAALERAGVRVRGGVRVVRDPALSAAGLHGAPRTGAHVLAVLRSPPLSDVARVTNHVSHNLFADESLRTAARAAHGSGSFEAGEHAVARMLPAADPPRMLDGSGLSRLNRVSARTVVALLALMERSAPFRASLPEAGSPAGLRRMAGTPASGNLRAKTGTLATVSALSGYVTAANGERLAFAVLSNDVRPAAAKEMENRIGARLARFTR